MRTGTIAFLLGILLLQQYTALPDSVWTWLLLLSLPLSLILPHPVNLPAWFISGFLWCLLIAHHVLSTGIEPELEGKNILIEGQIANLPLKYQRRTGFVFDVQQASYNGERIPTPGRIRLSWYGKYSRKLVPGETWRMVVRLKRPSGLMNPGGFDYEAWLFQHRIRATGYVRKSEQNQKLSSAEGYFIQRGRFWLKSRIKNVVGDNNSLGLLLALTLGDKSKISAGQWQGLQLTGTSHLMAISGLHIGLFAGIAYFLGQFFWRLSGRGMLIIAAPRVGAVAAIVAAILYAALAGFAIPTQRAVIMVVVVMFALWRSQPGHPSRVLATALLLVLLFDPLSVLSVSFWLSFAAVAIIYYSGSGRLVTLSKWRQGIQIQVWISLGMFPLVLFWFQQVSLISPLVNLIVVPLVGLFVVPLAILGTFIITFWPWLGGIVLSIPLWFLNGFTWFITSMNQWAWLQWHNSAGLLQISLASVGVLVLLMPRGFPGKYMGAALLLPILFGSQFKIAPNSASFTLLDVGQGLSAVVLTRNHTLVFDTGVRLSDRFDMGQAVVLPYLRQYGRSEIDTLIISHGDNDHSGGFNSVWAQIPVTRVISSVPDKLSPDSAAQPCIQGDHWSWDGVEFEILHPNKTNRFKRNNASCVLKVSAGGKSVLLTGDIEKPAERQLLTKMTDNLDADILIAAHHGSKTSSSRAFIDAVSPSFVLYPVGYRNRYRFPAKRVVQSFTELGVQQLQTDSSGAISFLLGEHEGLTPQQYRHRVRRYWHRP